MSDPYHHAISSSKKWGGEPEDYLHIHQWFDASKAGFCDNRHRAMRHHGEGIAWAIEHFGPTITVSSGRVVPVRWVGEQHVKEDIGRIPTMAEWLREMNHKQWMTFGVRKLSVKL